MIWAEDSTAYCSYVVILGINKLKTLLEYIYHLLVNSHILFYNHFIQYRQMISAKSL